MMTKMTLISKATATLIAGEHLLPCMSHHMKCQMALVRITSATKLTRVTFLSMLHFDMVTHTWVTVEACNTVSTHKRLFFVLCAKHPIIGKHRRTRRQFRIQQ